MANKISSSKNNNAKVSGKRKKILCSGKNYYCCFNYRRNNHYSRYGVEYTDYRSFKD